VHFVDTACLFESCNKQRIFAKKTPYICNDVEFFLLEAGTEFILGLEVVSGTCHSHRGCSRRHGRFQKYKVEWPLGTWCLYVSWFKGTRMYTHTHTHTHTDIDMIP